MGFSSSVEPFFFFLPPFVFGSSCLSGRGSTTSLCSVGISTGTFGSFTGAAPPPVLAFLPWSPPSLASPSSSLPLLLAPPCVSAASFTSSSAGKPIAPMPAPDGCLLSASIPALSALIWASNFPSLIMRRIRSSMSSV